jgi:hypothetical protein
MEALIIILGGFGLIAGLVTILALWRGFVATKLWLWFVVPHFGLAPLPLHIAIGLSALIGLYHAYRPTADKDDKGFLSIFFSLLLPALSLLFGWVVFSLNA